jgi:hypothetical protein
MPKRIQTAYELDQSQLVTLPLWHYAGLASHGPDPGQKQRDRRRVIGLEQPQSRHCDIQLTMIATLIVPTRGLIYWFGWC